MNAASWALRAACRGRDLDEFFTESKNGMRRAKNICAACPVRQRCLAEVMAAEDQSARHGVFGGLTTAERRDLAKRKRRGTAVTG